MERNSLPSENVFRKAEQIDIGFIITQEQECVLWVVYRWDELGIVS
jgi:hypothetical protein